MNDEVILAIWLLHLSSRYEISQKKLKYIDQIIGNASRKVKFTPYNGNIWKKFISILILIVPNFTTEANIDNLNPHTKLRGKHNREK